MSQPRKTIIDGKSIQERKEKERSKYAMSRKIEITNGGKICTSCETWKELKYFGVKEQNPDGWQYICKDCKNSKRREYYHENPDAEKRRQKEYKERQEKKIQDGTLTPPEKKVCHACEREKDASEFGTYPQSKDGLKAQCKACYRDYAKKYYREGNHKERILERTKKRHKENKMCVRKKHKEWRDRNKVYISRTRREKAEKRAEAYTPVPGTGKTCFDCLIWKYYEDFVFNRHKLDLHDKRCKVCHRAYMREYLRKRKEREGA